MLVEDKRGSGHIDIVAAARGAGSGNHDRPGHDLVTDDQPGVDVGIGRHELLHRPRVVTDEHEDRGIHRIAGGTGHHERAGLMERARAAPGWASR